MLAREWKVAVMLTVVAMVIVLTSGYAAWYEIDSSQGETSYYLTFSSSRSGHYTPYYTSGDISNLMNHVIGLIILWIAAGLVFAWSCLRESRVLAVLFGLALIIVPAAVAIYFALAVPGAMRSEYGPSVPVDDFAGQSINDFGTVYTYGPRVGWYLCSVAAVLQAACAIQLILPNRSLLRKDKRAPLGE